MREASRYLGSEERQAGKVAGGWADLTNQPQAEGRCAESTCCNHRIPRSGESDITGSGEGDIKGLSGTKRVSQNVDQLG